MNKDSNRTPSTRSRRRFTVRIHQEQTRPWWPIVAQQAKSTKTLSSPLPAGKKRSANQCRDLKGSPTHTERNKKGTAVYSRVARRTQTKNYIDRETHTDKDIENERVTDRQRERERVGVRVRGRKMVRIIVTVGSGKRTWAGLVFEVREGCDGREDCEGCKAFV